MRRGLGRMAETILTPSQLSTFDFGRALSVKIPSSEQLSKTLSDLRPLQGSALLIGGIAVIHYGYERTTKDIDLLYANADTSILKRLAERFKVVRNAESGWHHLEHKETKIRLELIPEGGLTTYGFIPGPQTVGSENGVISLWGLLLLKLVSGRAQDEADIVTLAKEHLAELPEIRSKIDAQHHARFDQLVLRAKQELENDPGR
jgi:hypothetical protein